MKRRFSAVLLSLGAFALLSSCALGPVGTSSPSPTPSAALPASSPTSTAPADGGEKQPVGVMGAFSATDLDGNTIDQSIFEDYGLTMVNVWATFCKPCLNEMPDLNAIHTDYADKGFQVVGLVADTLDREGALDAQQVELAKDVVAQTGANYTHILPSSDLFGILSQATSVPLTFFVDKDGAQVGQAYVGSRSKDDWIAIIDPLLSEVKK